MVVEGMGIGLIAAPTVAYLALWALASRRMRSLRRQAYPDPPEWPSLSLLKPLKGAEQDLEQNLESFFRQDYPGALELVFSSTESDDQGIAVARRVAARWPHVQVKWALATPHFGLNPKVANLAGALQGARHEWLLQSDGNVRIATDYCQSVVREALARRAALSTSLLVGVGEATLPAAWENAHLCSSITSSVCALELLTGHVCIIGKSILLQRSGLEAVGGLRRVRDVLCEDHMLGELYRRSGRQPILSATRVENFNNTTSFRGFLSRHARWLKMRAVIHRGAFIMDMVLNVPFLGALGTALCGASTVATSAFFAACAVKLAGDASLVRTLRSKPVKTRYLLSLPIKDILMGMVWLHASVSRTVVWRGTKLRFGRHSILKGARLDVAPSAQLDKDTAAEHALLRSATP